MKIRKSFMHGRLENEVEDFIATLENEFDYDIINVSIQFIETKEDGERKNNAHFPPAGRRFKLWRVVN